MHFLNQTPIDAYTKRQSTVETATYGSEFVAARTAVDQIIDIRTTLRYLGVPIRDKSYMFGDNKSVVTSSTIPNSTISKRHHLASYHRVREAIAAKFISFHWKDGKSNPADILSKHWEFAAVWPMLKPILFWRGDTATQLKGSDRIPSTTPGAEPHRDAKDSGSARSHSPHLETSPSDRPFLPDGTQISASRPAHAGRPDSNEIFQLPPKIKRPNLHMVRYTCHCEQYQPHT